MTDLSSLQQTQTLGSITTTPAPEKTRTIGEIVEDTGFLRNQSRTINEDINDLHHEAIGVQFDTRSHQLAQSGPQALLDLLYESGFSWREIARMVGVSVPAVRRWRNGESPTPAHLFSIARLVALKEIIEANNPVVDLASWLALPISPLCPITGIDLAAAGSFQELFDLAGFHESPEGILDRFDPEWRKLERPELEVFEAADGEMGIRLVEPPID